MMMIDVERLKWLKREIRKVEKSINKSSNHDEAIDRLLNLLNIWDKIRKNCFFLTKDKLFCKYSLKTLKGCDPIKCPLGKNYVVVVKDSIVVIE